MSDFQKVTQSIEDAAVGGYKKIETATVSGYKKIEQAAVSGYQRVEDHFVKTFLAKEGESVEDAKARLAREQTEHHEQASK